MMYLTGKMSKFGISLKAELHWWSKRPLVSIFSLFLLSFPCYSQQQTLTLESYLQLVRQNHPAAKQALLLNEQADAMLLRARGSFDPKMYGEWERKSFDGKNYYNIGEGGVKWPTWYGIEAKLAYNYASGIYVNPENTLPADGQAVIGLTVPLLQGLFIDERRAGLFQANILRSANENELRLQMNDLLYGAAKNYWNWALADANLRVYEEAVKVARQRFEAQRESYLQGDKPAIDTLEAFIQVQDRLIQRNDAQTALQNAILDLQNFLWSNEKPLPIDTTAQRPIVLQLYSGSPTLLDKSIEELAASHPALQLYDFKIQQLKVERRLKTELLKPSLDVSYNFLGNGLDLNPATDDSGFSHFLRNNYKLGLSFGFPLLLRKERGGLQLTELKLMDMQLGLSQKRLEIQNKCAAYQNDLTNLQNQLNFAVSMRDNYVQLVEAEKTKMAIGESSLFLLNSRENKLIEAEIKLLKLLAEMRKAEVSLQWAAGVLK